MTYNEQRADRIRAVFASERGLPERRMFDRAVFKSKTALSSWLDLATAFVVTLPAKPLTERTARRAPAPH
jgi:hypothetical protein